MSRRSKRDERAPRVTLPPEKYGPALSSLEADWRRLGTEVEEEKRHRRRREGRNRTAARVGVPLLAVLALAGGTTATGTNPFWGSGGTQGAKDAPRDQQTGTAHRGLAEAADPGGESLRWGVAIEPGKDDPTSTCVLAGRVLGQQVGNVEGGQFFGLAIDAPAKCQPQRYVDSTHVVFVTRNYNVRNRSLFFGYADRTVRTLSLVIGPKRQNVPIASDGTFIAVREGACAFRGEVLTLDGPPNPLRQPLSVRCIARG
jgi:hypothetical protein